MTHQEKLNSLLHVLLYLQRKVVVNTPMNKKITFAWLCKTVAETEDQWEVEFLRQILLNDGYIIAGRFGDGEPPEITHSGIKFIQTGGYIKEKEQKELDEKIKAETLKSLHRSRTAIIISVIAIVVPTAISLFTLLETRKEHKTLDLPKSEINYKKDSLHLGK
jgi:hypothetical protein